MLSEGQNSNESSVESDNARDEFLRHFAKERSRIYAFIYSLLPNPTDAEDVFQQTSIALWRSFHKYDPDREFYKWACGVSFYTTMNFRRDAKRRSLPVLFSEQLVEQLADTRLANSGKKHARLEMLDECISHLKDRDRVLLSSVYKEGTAIKDVAEKTNRTINTIYNRLSKIRKDLLHCVNRKLASRAS